MWYNNRHCYGYGYNEVDGCCGCMGCFGFIAAVIILAAIVSAIAR